MIMNNKNHILTKVWGSFPDIMENNYVFAKPQPIEKIIAEMFSVGEFYYYILNVTNSDIFNCSNNILKMHGLKHVPNNVGEIIDLIHPDDLAFVVAAERMTIEKIKEIGCEHHMQLKCSYCFRMKTKKGNYELFHHQSLHIKKSEAGKLVQAINIHTNIHHLTPINNYVVLVSGIGGRTDFHQMTINDFPLHSKIPSYLTRREIEILQLICNGNSSQEISQFLNLSVHTVNTHRKNILKKTEVQNSTELIKNCVEWGII